MCAGAIVNGRVERLVFGAAVIWAVIYDTFYAMVDREDDKKIGVKSTAILFGDVDLFVVELPPGLYEVATEAFYRLQLTSYLQMTTSVQGIFNPLDNPDQEALAEGLVQQSRLGVNPFRLGLIGAIPVTCLAIIGSHSRGALVAGTAMLLFLVAKSRQIRRVYP